MKKSKPVYQDLTRFLLTFMVDGFLTDKMILEKVISRCDFPQHHQTEGEQTKKFIWLDKVDGSWTTARPEWKI